MKVIVCVDDMGGMMFNKRRQSRDREVVRDILSFTEGKKLWMDTYSSPLFGGFESRVSVDDDFPEHMGDDEICFVENRHLAPYLERIDTVIVYKWNRRYPADFYLDLQPDEWEKTEVRDFEGNSHEKITKEIYIKGEV